VIHFFDSSALVKRYLREPGSDAVRAAVRRGPVTVVRITYAELLATFARAEREGLLTQLQRRNIFEDIEDDFQKWTIVEVRRRTLERVSALVLRHPLRGYDAVQLAAALSVHEQQVAVQFWSADERLTNAARAEGMRTMVPA